MPVEEVFTLIARVCNHCGCLFVPATAYSGKCPVNGEHTEYSGAKFMLMDSPSNWSGGISIEEVVKSRCE